MILSVGKSYLSVNITTHLFYRRLITYNPAPNVLTHWIPHPMNQNQGYGVRFVAVL